MPLPDDVLTGAWFVELNDGAFGFTDHGGSWSPGWQVHVIDANGRAVGSAAPRDTTGQWYQAITTGPGTFSLATGTFDPGATVVAEVPRVP